MNFRTAKAWQPELLDKRPRKFRTESREQFEAILERGKLGEFTITGVNSMSKPSGKDNAVWEIEVRYDK